MCQICLFQRSLTKFERFSILSDAVVHGTYVCINMEINAGYKLNVYIIIRMPSKNDDSFVIGKPCTGRLQELCSRPLLHLCPPKFVLMLAVTQFPHLQNQVPSHPDNLMCMCAFMLVSLKLDDYKHSNLSSS